MGDGFTVVLRVALFVVVIVIVVDFVVDVVVVVGVAGRRPKTTPRAIPVNITMIANDPRAIFITEKNS